MTSIKSIAAVLCVLMFTACGDPTDDEPLSDDPVDDETVVNEGLSDNNQMAETIMATIVDSPKLSSFAELLQETDLADRLGETEGISYTVFAPTDKAFNSLQPVTVDWLLMDEHMDRMTDLLGYHIVDDVIEPEEVGSESQVYTTLYEDHEVEVMIRDDGMYIVKGVNVMKIMQTSNGTIYMIGEVLIPDDWVEVDAWDEVDY